MIPDRQLDRLVFLAVRFLQNIIASGMPWVVTESSPMLTDPPLSRVTRVFDLLLHSAAILCWDLAFFKHQVVETLWTNPHMLSGPEDFQHHTQMLPVQSGSVQTACFILLTSAWITASLCWLEALIWALSCWYALSLSEIWISQNSSLHSSSSCRESLRSSIIFSNLLSISSISCFSSDCWADILSWVCRFCCTSRFFIATCSRDAHNNPADW